MELPIAVTHEKSNHASSLYIEKEIHTNQPLGHNSFDCEVRNKDIKNYSFQLLTDALSIAFFLDWTKEMVHIGIIFPIFL